MSSYDSVVCNLLFKTCVPDYAIQTPPFSPLQLHSNSDKGDGSVRYLLSGEGAGTIFLINEVTGDIHATKSLDREKKAHYVLHAQAIDRHTNRSLEPESEFIIKVQDVNDNAPKFPDGPFVASVAEMSDVGKALSPRSLIPHAAVHISWVNISTKNIPRWIIPYVLPSLTAL